MENTYTGEMGRHRWRADYQLRLVEDHSADREASTIWRDGVAVATSYAIVPQELKYVFHADQHYDRGTHELRRRADGTIYRGDLRMLGEARGAFDADQLARREVLRGSISSFAAPADSPNEQARRFASHEDYVDFVGQQTTNPEPGGYHLSIGFPSDDDGSWQAVRALYKGIERTGLDPPAHPDDPAVDFIGVVHAVGYMPDGTMIIGRLESPDQGGADAYNQALSERRAESVKQWLVANGQVNGGNVATRGRGKAKPVAPNQKADGSDDPEGRARNRRVQITVRK